MKKTSLILAALLALLTTGLAYAAVLLASLLSLALQPGPGDGALPDEPLLSLAAWASATAACVLAMLMPTGLRGP